MLMGWLIGIGTVAGLAISVLGHPKGYRAVFGGGRRSLDGPQ